MNKKMIKIYSLGGIYKNEAGYMKKMLMIGLSLLFAQVSYACTDIAVTKGASSNNSNMLAMTDDAYDRDFRIIRVPAADHKADSKRPIYKDHRTYPRFNIKNSAKYYHTPGVELSKPVAYIDQVPHTYAYFDGIYGLMNEHQLSMAESSCGVKSYLGFKAGERILEIKDLMRIALERCKGSRETVKLFGDLVKKYGYYGGGENIIIADTEEIWVFEIAGTPSGRAVWVAKRIPDGEIFASSNIFAIRDVIKDSDDMMYSDNLFSDCKAAGWYDPEKDKTFDWLKVVSNGEYGHPYYSLRRVWRVYDLLAPSKKFSPWVKDTYTKEYPFSIKPDNKVSIDNLKSTLRDWFGDTELDMSKGLSAGAFGSIYRFDANPKSKVKGNWEQPISRFRCAYSYITQSRKDMPDMIGGVLWWGNSTPHSTCYVPFYCGVSDIPESYQTGNNRHFDRNNAWWAFNYVNNILPLKFSFMIEDVQKLQNEIEGKELALQPFVEKAAMAAYDKDPKLAQEYLTEYCNSNAEAVFKAWWKLGDSLFVKYQNGFLIEGKSFSNAGYNDEWLKKVDFKPITYKKSAPEKSEDLKTAGGNPEK